MAHQWLRDNPILGTTPTPLGTRPDTATGPRTTLVPGYSGHQPGPHGPSFVRASPADDEDWDAGLDDSEEEDEDLARAKDEDFVLDDDDDDLQDEIEDDFVPSDDDSEGALRGRPWRATGAGGQRAAAKRKRGALPLVSSSLRRPRSSTAAGRFIVDDDDESDEAMASDEEDWEAPQDDEGFVVDDEEEEEAASSSEEEFMPSSVSRRHAVRRKPPAPVPFPTRLRIKLINPPPRPSSSRNLRASSSQISYGESSDESDEEAAASAAASREVQRLKKAPPALLSPEELETIEPEVELVIKHRSLMTNGVDTNSMAMQSWDQRELYVKWARRSYLHCSWEKMDRLRVLPGFKRVLNYCKKVEERDLLRQRLGADEREELDLQVALEEELEDTYSTVDRIVAERDVQGRLQYLVKWKGLPYAEATFEAAEDVLRVGAGEAISRYHQRESGVLSKDDPGSSVVTTRLSVDAARRSFAGRRAMTEQPAFLKGGSLRDYQLDSLNWLSYSWSRGCNCILADEMGLGKTVQCASMLGWLAMEAQLAGPFLVVVPLSVVTNWIREFERWVPMLNLVVYVGTAASREVIRHFEFYNAHQRQHSIKFDVLLTTYEMVIKDAEILRPIRWNYLMVDEAHRLKNEGSALYRELSSWSIRSKLLVTGTPLQNNIRELWALLAFLEPGKFGAAEDFVREYDTTDPEAVARLHALLRPHLLRRVIKDVEKSLPPKTERILRVGMTPLQKQYYKWILTRNYAALNRGSKAQVTLINIIMDLKKCCNHPFLFDSAEENYRRTATSDMDEATRLVHTSGKMVLLDKLLRRLKETGHRVLIFSQMVRVLDILADYCRLRGYAIQRLDGSTPAAARHAAMEAFNAPGSKDFAFLLSTRAGGLGINLATADTVIIFDSDWNPQNDLQAMSRAHRIGQKDAVNIYRFVTSGSVEEDILERAKNKMVLDHLVIQRMDTSGKTVLQGAGGGSSTKGGSKLLFNKDEMADILRFGAEDLFKEDENATESRGQALLEEDLDAILARAEVIDTKPGEEGSRGDELLGAFNVATFQTNESDAEFWNRLIPKDEIAKAEEEERRRQVEEEPVVRAARLRSMEPAGGAADEGSYNNSKNAKISNSGGAQQQQQSTAHARISRWPKAVDAHGHLIHHTTDNDQQPAIGSDFPASLSKRDAQAFMRAARKYLHPGHLPQMASECGGILAAASQDALRALWFGLRRGCREATEAAKNENTEANIEPRLDFFGVDIKAAEFEQLAVGASFLAAKVHQARASGRLVLEKGEYANQTQWMKACGWAPAQDACLLLGFFRYGIGSWDKMADDPELSLETWLVNAVCTKTEDGQARPDDSSPMPKASFLDTRVHALLRQLEKHHRRPLPKQKKDSKGKESRPKAPKHSPVVHPPSTSTNFADVLGEPTMLFVRKLKTLGKRSDEMPPAAVANKYQKYLVEVGNRIEELAGGNSDKAAKIWNFVEGHAEIHRLQKKNLLAEYSKFKAK